jgi:DMSO/TMAO reductase YedYZ molybdopterin-dependent catalytic subunit
MAGMVGLGLGEVAAAAQGRSLVDALGRAVVDWSPRSLVDLTVDLLGSKDKAAIRIGVGATMIATTIGLGGLPARVRTPTVAGLAVATAGLSLRRPPRSPLATVSAATVGAVATSVGLSRRPVSAPGAAALAGVGVGALTTARLLLAHQRRQHGQLSRRALGPDRWPNGGAVPDDGIEGQPALSSLITPVDQFYVTDVNLGAPLVDAEHWQLALTGLVARPQRVSLADLAADAEEFDAVMVCILNPVGRGRVDNCRSLGVPLQTVLERENPPRSATTLVTRAVDGFTTSLPLDPLLAGEWPAYVVIGLNGERLPAEHGFPARVFVPGIYGQYTGAKWLAELELTAGPHSDYWSPRGWPHQPARVQPQARIDVSAPGTVSCAASGRTVNVAGVAWAPPHGLAAVEVRAGQGSWHPADLARELGPSSWRRWQAALDLAPGTHAVQARAISRSGEVQDGRERPPFPLGASGWHTVTVTVSP